MIERPPYDETVRKVDQGFVEALVDRQVGIDVDLLRRLRLENCFEIDDALPGGVQGNRSGAPFSSQARRHALDKAAELDRVLYLLLSEFADGKASAGDAASTILPDGDWSVGPLKGRSL